MSEDFNTLNEELMIVLKELKEKYGIHKDEIADVVDSVIKLVEVSCRITWEEAEELYKN